MTSHKSSEDSQRSGASGGAHEARQKASERLGQWVKGKYRLETLLGVGGMASVYSARHRNGSRAALKILHTEFAREEAIKVRFLREGYVANKVDHPGVVRIIDDDVTEQGEPYLLMELLEGETLRQRWKRRRKKMPVAEALKIAEAVLDTLVPFHEANIIHRDLKPANIFICQDGLIKLLDFGVAQMRETGGAALTRAGTALGTPSYMSPEQAQGHSDNLDARADIFSVGATLYAVLSGKRLLHGKSANEAFILAATQPAPSLARSAPDLPVEVIALVDRALKWDRRKRFRSASAMRESIREILSRIGEPAPTSSPAPRSAPPPTTPRSAEPPSTPLPRVQSLSSSPPTAVATDAAKRQVKPPPTPLPELVFNPPIGVARPGASGPPSSPRGMKQTLIGGPPVSRPPPVSHPPLSGGRLGDAPPITPAPGLLTPSDVPPAPDVQISETGGVAAADDPLVQFFERFEKALPTLRQYGLEHPEGQNKTRTLHRALQDVLREMPGGIHFQVHPFCFTNDSGTLWEPGPPHDQVPYGLASSGVEDIHISTGVSEEEVRQFLKIIVIDPQLGLTEGDIGAALWEAGLTNIACKVRDDLADADAREQVRFFSDTDEVVEEVRRDLAKVAQMMAKIARPSMQREDHLEAAAMAMTTDTDMFRASKVASQSLRIERSAAVALSEKLTFRSQEWLERFYEIAPLALLDAAEREDLGIIYKEVEQHVDRWANAGRWDEVIAVHDTLTDGLRRRGSDATPVSLEITRQLFSWSRIRSAYAVMSSAECKPETRAEIMQVLSRVMPELDSDLVREHVLLASELFDEELSRMALSYADHHMKGHEATILKMLDELRPEMAQRMLAAVTRDKTPENIELLKPLLMSSNPALRCEATALLAQSPEELGKQLVRLLGSQDVRLRSAALTTMVRHQVRHAGPGLVHVIEDGNPASRTDAELRQMFDTLYALNPPRAESLLTAIVSKHGLMSDEALDRVRAIAADTLGKNADSANPLEALENAGRLRPWNTQVVRGAATSAADALRERLKARGAAAGSKV